MADFEANRRLKYLIKEVFKTTPFAFSQKYNDNGGVKTSQILRERNGLSSKMLSTILEAYPEINKNWLLTGEGEMIKHTGEQPQADTPTSDCECPMSTFISEVLDNSRAITDAMKEIVESNTQLIRQQSELIATIRALAEKRV